MGIHNLFGVCFAVFSISALAADPPVPRSNVSATLNPTTGYYSSTNSTVRLPSGVSISPSSASVPVVSKYSGGLQQTIPTGVTIDAIKKSAPLPAVVRANTASLKASAKVVLRGNLAGLALGAGLQALLDSVDALIGENGTIEKINYALPVGATNWCMNSPSSMCGATPSSVLELFKASEGRPDLYLQSASAGYNVCTESGYCGYAFILKRSSVCPVGYPWQPRPIDGCAKITTQPMPEIDLDEAIDSSYNPEPSDWVNLTPHLDLDDVEITSAPTLSGNPKTKTIYDAEGNPVEVQETNIWYDFDIRDNRSSSPALDLKTRQETKTYKNGALTGTTTTTDTDSAGVSGGGGGSNVNIDIPTDCEFMPTVCAFLEWFKTDDTPEDPDLSALIDNRDFTESYSITGGSKQCPADYEFTVDFIGRTYGLSFEPACDFASKMYYFVMAAAYIFAAYITIGASRNG